MDSLQLDLDWDGAVWRVCHHHRVRWAVAGHAKNSREWKEYAEHQRKDFDDPQVRALIEYAEVANPRVQDVMDAGCPMCTAIPAGFRALFA